MKTFKRALVPALAMLSTMLQPLPLLADPAPPPIEQALPGDRAGGWARQTRSEVVARNGMVTTSHPLAAQAGLDVLKAGGNAIDAAIATAAVLNVVEPESAGIGGDAFAIVWLAKERKLIAMNASGHSPAAATLAAYRAKGFERVPLHGIHSVTVPGAVAGWDALLKRAGTMGFDRLLEPAAKLADEGFAVSERIRHDWDYGATVLAADKDSVATYLPKGAPPPLYSTFRNPDLAKAFRLLQQGGADAFYRGPIRDAILAKSKALGGLLAASDFEAEQVSWEMPISTRYRGHDVFEMPPSTQGFATLEMLNIVEACSAKFGLDLAKLGPRSADYWHLAVEAKKLAYADLNRHNGDPAFSKVPVSRLISKDYAASLCSRIDMRRAAPAERGTDAIGGTVYLATADRDGNMVSFIYSVYDSFGSGITVPGYGFVLADRGALFSMDPKSPNVIAPRKRPFHTLLPGFLMKDGLPVAALGLMGGSQQAQGHAQAIINMLDFGANMQAASDAARFSHSQFRDRLALETQLAALVGPELTARGHDVAVELGDEMGGYQAIRFIPDLPGQAPEAAGPGGPLRGAYAAGSDHRKDGLAAGW